MMVCKHNAAESDYIEDRRFKVVVVAVAPDGDGLFLQLYAGEEGNFAGSHFCEVLRTVL